MIHIVFSEKEVTLMQQVIALDDTLFGEVIQVKDDFAVGPLAHIDTEDGWQTRKKWWHQLLDDDILFSEAHSSIDDRKNVEALIKKLRSNSNEVLWIWMAQNQHDVCGYYWLVSRLREFEGRIMVLYLNNLPFINEKGQIFYPTWLHEIQPSEFLKAKKLARSVTTSEFEIDSNEWNKLMQENATIRVLEGGKKITGQNDDFYDAEILKNMTGEKQKASKVVSNTLHKMKVKTGDILMWRIKELIEKGQITVEGNIGKDWKLVDIKISNNNAIDNEGQLITSTTVSLED